MNPFAQPWLNSVSTEKKSVNKFCVTELCHTHFQSSTPEQLKHFEIIYVNHGEGTLTADLKKYTLSDNIVYCLAPGQYRLLTLTGKTKGYCISLSPEFLYMSESMISHNSNEWIVSPDTEMEDLIVRMHKESLRQDSLCFEILRSLLKIFIIYLYRASQFMDDKQTAIGKDKLIVLRFFELLQKHFACKKLVSDYASELCITPNYLNSVVKRHTGFPASYHIQQCIIAEAKRQAIYSGLCMKEVANKLGFDDYAHFSKFFKNYSGVNFSNFKKGIQ